jgi:hypothetical protein
MLAWTALPQQARHARLTVSWGPGSSYAISSKYERRKHVSILSVQRLDCKFRSAK